MGVVDQGNDEGEWKTSPHPVPCRINKCPKSIPCRIKIVPKVYTFNCFKRSLKNFPHMIATLSSNFNQKRRLCRIFLNVKGHSVERYIPLSPVWECLRSRVLTLNLNYSGVLKGLVVLLIHQTKQPFYICKENLNV